MYACYVVSQHHAVESGRELGSFREENGLRSGPSFHYAMAHASTLIRHNAAPELIMSAFFRRIPQLGRRYA